MKYVSQRVCGVLGAISGVLFLALFDSSWERLHLVLMLPTIAVILWWLQWVCIIEAILIGFMSARLKYIDLMQRYLSSKVTKLTIALLMITVVSLQLTATFISLTPDEIPFNTIYCYNRMRQACTNATTTEETYAALFPTQNLIPRSPLHVPSNTRGLQATANWNNARCHNLMDNQQEHVIEQWNETLMWLIPTSSTDSWCGEWMAPFALDLKNNAPIEGSPWSQHEHTISSYVHFALWSLSWAVFMMLLAARTFLIFIKSRQLPVLEGAMGTPKMNDDWIQSAKI